VATVNVIESIPLLDDAAIEAVKQWIYEPTLVNDVPVPVIMTVRVSFTLKLDASPARPADGAGTLAYVNPAFHWSIAYPSDWQLSSTDPRVVRITLIGQGLIGFYSGFFPKLASLDEFVDYMKKDREEHLAQRISLRFVSQRLLTLPNGSAAIEIIDQLGTGIVGQSRKIDTQLGDHTYLEIDAESKLEDWPGVEPVFTRIIDSFKVAPGK
jgi:hypothetical protein